MHHIARPIVTSAIAMAIAFTTLLSPAHAQPNPASDIFTRGISAYQRHEYQQAIEAFTQIVEQGETSAKLRAAAYSNRCLIELELGHNASAIGDCTRGIQLNSSNSESYLNRGLAYHHLENYEAAIADYNRLLEQIPDDYRAFYNRGLAQFSLKHYEEAIADYNRSMGVNREILPASMVEIYNDRGLAYLLLEKYDEAIADFSQAIAEEDSDTRAYFNRGCVFQRLGNKAAALRDYHRVLAIDPTHAETYFNLGTIDYQMGQLDVAAASFEQAAYYFYVRNEMEGYRQAIKILERLQDRSELAVAREMEWEERFRQYH